MKSLFSLIVLPLFISGLISGCSSSSGGGGQPAAVPLTAAQTEQLDLTAKNVSDISNWQTSNALSPRPTFLMPAITDRATEAAKEAAKTEIQKRIFDSRVCTVNVIQSKPDAPSSDPSQPKVTTTEAGASIAGTNCPITFSWSKKSNQTYDPTAQTIASNSEFSLYFRGQSLQAEKLDIALYQFTVKTAFSGGSSGMTGSSTGTGQILSRSQGKIVISFNSSMQPVGQSLVSTNVASLTYTDGLFIEFKNVTTWNQQSQIPVQAYFINNSPVSESVFMKYNKSFGLDKTSSPSSRSESSRL